MRTERAVLFGTHFFLRTETNTFSTHMGIRQNALLLLISALILQCQKDERSKKSLKGIIPKQRTKVKGVLSEE